MKYIKVFLASSIVEFKMERLEFKNFVHLLDGIFSQQDLRLDPIGCEDMSNELSITSKQDDINEEIPNCQYFYVIIGKEAGEKTVEEFEVALKSRKSSGQPKIYTYFYKLDDTENQTESVHKFVERIADDLGHYFSTFTNIDTVMLDFLMEFCRDHSTNMQLSFEDGEAVLQGEKVLSLKNIPIYGKNEDLTELREKKDKLNARFAELCAAYASSPEDSIIYKELVRVSEERAHVLDQFRKLEKDVFALYKEVSTYKNGTTELTWYEREAQKQVENGNYAGAIAILQDKQRKKDLDQAMLMADTGLDKIEAHIRENELLIKTLKAQKRTSAIFEEIDRCYNESAELTIKYSLNYKVLYEYAEFLVNDGSDYKKIIKLAEIMKTKTEDDDAETLGDIYYIIAEAYLYTAHKLLEGRENYYNAIECYNRVKDSFKKYRRIIWCYHRLAFTYRITGFTDYEAEYLVCKTLLSILDKHKRFISSYYEGVIYTTCSYFYNDEGKYKSVLKAQEYAELNLELAKKSDNSDWIGTSYIDLGDLYKAQKKYDKAYEMYINNYNERKKEYDKDSYNIGGLAKAAKSVGNLLEVIGRYNEAIEYTKESLKYFKELAERNPLGYEYGLTNCLQIIGSQYEDVYDYYNAEKSYREAYIRRKRSLDRDDVYEFEVIYSCRALAYILTVLNRFQEAEDLYREALEMSIQYAKKDPSNESYVRSSKYQLACNCLEPMHKYEEEEQYLSELIDWKRNNNSDNDSVLVDYLEDYASLLCKMEQAERAVDLQKESLEIWESYNNSTEDPFMYSIRIHNMAWVFIEAKQYDKAFPYLEKEIQIREQLVKDGREGMEWRLSSTYQLRGDYCSAVEQFEEAKVYYEKALQGYSKLAEICPDAFASNIAETERDYAKLLIKMDQFNDAEEYCQKAIEMYTELVKKASIVYKDDLTDAYETFVTIQKNKS